jgi:hypothetical protein
MDRFWKSFTTGKGDKVEMSVFEVILYILVPFAGQPIMRIHKFGGSLDKPYLLFPLLLIPPFSILPTLLAYFGFLDKIEGSNPLDVYIIIPTIIKLILIFFAVELGSSRGKLLHTLIIISAIMFANTLHMYTQEYCKTIPDTIFTGKLGKIAIDSMLEYGLAVLIVLSLQFFPVIGKILTALKEQEGLLSNVVESLAFGLSVAFAYLIVNMVDVNYVEKTDICNGSVGPWRGSISLIIFAIGIFIQLYSSIGGIISGEDNDE